jgi:catecholate siderophore receptor
MSIKFKTRKKKTQSQTSWPIAYRWAAVGTLVAYSAGGSKTLGVARAQDVVRPGSSRGAVAQTQGTQPARRFDIPAGSLDSALAAFEQITGIKVSQSKEGIGSLSSAGVTGLYTPEQALQKLLADTGLVYRFNSADAVSVDLKSVATSVEVTSSVEAIASSPKYSGAVLDTPQTISTVPETVMQEQGVTTLRDALRNVAGISLAAGEGGSQGDNLTVRGFSARNDLYIDGMRDFGSYYRDPFNMQEIEVLQGPSSVTFGRGSTGGVVNQATKTPGLTGFVSGGINVGTDLTRRGTLDIDKPFAAHAAFRLNLMGNMNDVAGRDIAENRRFGVSPSLAFGLGTATRWSFNYFHQSADDTPDYGIPWLFNGPAPVNRTNYYGFQNGNFLRTNDDIGTARVEHDFHRNITIRDQLRYANYGRDVRITEPQIFSSVTLAAPTIATPLSQMIVNRNELSSNSVEAMIDEQLDVTMKFKTGFLHHTLVTGVEGAKETSDPVRPKWTNVPYASLFNPDPYQTFSGTKTISSDVHTTALSVAAYFLDTIQLGKMWDLTGGFRWDRFDTAYTQQIAPASAFNRVDEMPSWRAALVFKPRPNGSIYFDAGTSFNPSAESLSLSAATANLPPEKSLTYEFGTKWDVRRLSLRSGVFRTNKYNAREPDPNNALLNVLAGGQRVDGFEFQAQGHLTSRWELLSSFAYLDSKVVSSNYYPAAIGYPLANVPKYTFNLWTEYRLPKRWEVGSGSNYVSSRTASSTVPLDPASGLLKELPGYWVFNAMVKHSLNEHFDVQVNVNNIANRYYYDQLHPAHIVLGAGRSAMLGLKFRF